MYNFYVREYGKPMELPVGSFELVTDPWDDFYYQTKFHMYYKESESTRSKIGEIKIGFKGQKPRNNPSTIENDLYKDATRRVLPKYFNDLNELDKDFFSLGQSPEFYENLYQILREETRPFLKKLNDISLNLNLLDTYRDESVLTTSLLRSIDKWEIQYQFHQIIHGRDKLSDFHFTFDYKNKLLNFEVKALSNPPTNIHALIGRNGVGKTTVLDNMFKELVDKNKDKKFKFYSVGNAFERSSFSKAIYISYSVFGKYIPNCDNRKNLLYIGFKYKEEDKILIKDSKELSKDFLRSINQILSSQSLVKNFNKIIEDISESYDNDIICKLILEYGRKYSSEDFRFFEDLSSGHSIVLLIIANLVSNVTEKTLILFDEPETHLHPPLLSALVRAINFILIQRNGICIFATHSPVVIQEIPQSCVQVISRTGDEIDISSPEIESFGENVSSLTHEIFSLEVKSSGFYKLLKHSFYESNCNVEHVIEKFEHKLGSEAISLLYMLKSNSIRNKETDKT